MCGITGISLSIGTELDPSRLRQSAQRLQHRGPDDTGFYFADQLGLAHTRLSIIDLSTGHQPLTSSQKDLILIANGEIYNHIELRKVLEAQGHRFQTHSDCEVILHAYVAYGFEFLTHLHGMFAFALYDKNENRLLLARDRLGIKPLFLAHVENGIAFASELKAFLPWFDKTPKLNPMGFIEYLQNQFSSGPTTLLDGVERLAPAEALCIENGVICKRWRYWSVTQVQQQKVGLEDARNEFTALMHTVMQQHMRSDVPFGLFLSGGVDSAILLAMLHRFSDTPVRTFSVGFSESSLVDELPLAKQIAEQFSSQHTEIRPSQNDIFYSLVDTVWAADELMRDYASLPTALLSRAAAKELKVVFSGEGGDEVFAGYGRYRSSWFERMFKQLGAPGTGGFRTRGNFRGRWPKRLFKAPLLEVIQHSRDTIIQSWNETPQQWSDLQRMQYSDLVTALPDNLLVKADRMMMCWGLEGRVPFLDHRIVEFGLSLPDAFKVHNGQGKWFLKHWAESFLPKDYLYARKRGFHVPIGEWLGGAFAHRLMKVLPDHPALDPWFHKSGVIALIKECGKSASVNRMIWALLQFAIWHQIYIRGSGARPEPYQEPLAFLEQNP